MSTLKIVVAVVLALAVVGAAFAVVGLVFSVLHVLFDVVVLAAVGYVAYRLVRRS